MRPHEVAWAAGLFDGEGSVSGYVARGRRARTVQITVYQKTTPVLERFQEAIGGAGGIHGPYRGRLYHWTTKRWSSVLSTWTLLSGDLSAEKRDQFERAFRGSSRYALFVATAANRPSADRQRELAWAAGFFAGEGSILLAPDASHAPRLELSQAAADGEPSSALVRFHRAVGGLGRLTGPRILRNDWSKLPQYRWEAASFEQVQAVIALLWQWMDDGRRSRAVVGLSEFERRCRNRARVASAG